MATDQDRAELRATVRRFLTGGDADWTRMARELGLQGLGLPESVGGSGCGPQELAVVHEELGRVLDASPFFATVALAATALLASGDEEYLPGIASGDTIAALALPEIGADPASRTEQLLVDSGEDGIFSLGDDFAISPDGKWLAHAHYGESDISIFVEPSINLLTKSSRQRIIWHPSQLSFLVGWLSNENIMLINEQSTMKFGSTLIRNPFSGEQHEFFLEEMPNALTQQYGMLGSYLLDHGNLIPDPTLTRIVYPLALDGDGFHVALLDTENKQELARIEYTVSQLSRGSFWSQDGSDFLMAGLTQEETIEWFQVNRDGTVRQLTYFGEFLQDAEFNLPSRSWDGRYLAFQLISNARKDSKYIFLDLKSQPLDGFCLNLGGEDSGSLHSPVWSPDNRYVAITHGEYSGRSSDVILVDVEKQQAFHIDHDDAQIYKVGWIVKP